MYIKLLLRFINIAMMRSTSSFSLLLFLCLALLLNQGIAHQRQSNDHHHQARQLQEYQYNYQDENHDKPQSYDQWIPPWARLGSDVNPWIPPWIYQYKPGFPGKRQSGNSPSPSSQTHGDTIPPWIPPWLVPFIYPWLNHQGTSPNTNPPSPPGKSNCHLIVHPGNPYSYSWNCGDDHNSSPGGQSTSFGKSNCRWEGNPSSYSYSCVYGNNPGGPVNAVPPSSGFTNLPSWNKDGVKRLQELMSDPSKPFGTPPWLKLMLVQRQLSSTNPKSPPVSAHPSAGQKA